MLYTVKFITYSGMPIPVLETEDRAKARRMAAKVLRARRKRGLETTTLVPGREWEVLTPEDAFMVSDLEGYLRLDETPEPEPQDEMEDDDGEE